MSLKLSLLSCQVSFKKLLQLKKTIALLALSFSSHAKDKKALVGNNQSDVSGKRLITRFSEKVFLNHK